MKIDDIVKMITPIMLGGVLRKPLGRISRIDGEYIYVIPENYKHEVECYRCELTHSMTRC